MSYGRTWAIALSNSSLLSSVTTNTSCADLRCRAMSLCPPVMGTDTLSLNLGALDFTREMTAGVIVLMPGHLASFSSVSIRLGRYVECVITTRPPLSDLFFLPTTPLFTGHNPTHENAQDSGIDPQRLLVMTEILDPSKCTISAGCRHVMNKLSAGAPP